jgi:hypothetical protein
VVAGFWEYVDSNASLRAETQGSINIQLNGNHLRTDGVVFSSVHRCSRQIRSDNLLQISDLTTDPPTLNAVEASWATAASAAEYPSSPYADHIKAFRQVLCGRFHHLRKTQEQDFHQYCRCMCSKSFSAAMNVPDVLSGDGSAEKYANDLRLIAVNRKFFVTQDGLYGMEPHLLEQGDLCCVLFGADLPLIIRRTGVNEQYRLIRQCCIRGVMDGEVIRMWREGLLQTQTIVLV